MYEFHPYFTHDGSVGLYSPEFNDIYHSATGALTEAYEKFVYPSNIDYLIQSKQEIKVLDICYGIGYNTKSFLNYIFEKFSKKNYPYTKHYAPIHTNKNNKSTNNYLPIYTDKNNENNRVNIDSIYANNNSTTVDDEKSNGAIYSNNIFPKISVTALDNDENLFYLSPFIKTGEKNFRKFNIDIPCDKVQKYLADSQKSEIIKIDDLINYYIYSQIIKKSPEIYQNSEIVEILNTKNLSSFFDQNIRGISKIYQNWKINYSPLESFICYLHNIYYHHVSLSYKKGLKGSIFDNIYFDFKCEDARKSIQESSDIYNLIFLDAFTPSKCPCLWSFEFFKLLFDHLEQDGMILTYSSSASVRSAMIEAGFYIGNIFCQRENKFIGTVAVKNKSLIKYPLSEFDLGLLKTRAGIFYRDENLTAQNEAIIAARNLEVKNSTRQSSSEYKKLYHASS